MHNNEVHIYTDGAASGNPGPGGLGIVMLYGAHRKEISRGYKLTTNNRMELLAVILALEHLKKAGTRVRLFSDSKYVTEAINQGWLKNWVSKDFKKVKNVDLWKRLLPALQRHQVTFVWVKGHASNIENNRCDELAVQAYKTSVLEEDYGYSPEN